MQRLLLFLLSSFFLTVSCKKSTDHGFLTKKDMANLMTEVHLIDGYLNTLTVDSTRKVIESLYQVVFDKFNIDSTDFKRNLTHYLGNPVEAKQIYEIVNANLAEQDREFRQIDSIRVAFVSDSMRIAQNYLKLKQQSEDLILKVTKDSIPFDYKLNAQRLMDNMGLGYVPVYGVTIPAVRMDSVKTEVEPTEVLLDSVAENRVKTIDTLSPIKEVKPMRKPGSTRLREPFRKVE